ncbi:CopD family protein [Neokomagataea anthophila]|uniref:Protoporphyrinogen IX oxidase n=1 Tax=Neokomagataea anthophila TaxID=2826925 RepID=A0ABS5E4W4_9PROT|nr:CopD family protein [Neokomagataea anthophila]MBR0558945.1 CopD family protein [Neokomagataea anthophila]
MQAVMEHVQWLIALHIMAFTAWMAGLFYLPRLFVYHCQAEPGSAEYERFTVMERKLLKQIMNPAMIVTILVGGTLASLPGIIEWGALWWWMKLIAVIGLCGFHGMCSVWRKQFFIQKNNHTERYYRIANEIPTILMMIVVIMIIVRP